MAWPVSSAPLTSSFGHCLVIGHQVRKVLGILAWALKGLSPPADSASLLLYPALSAPIAELFLVFGFFFFPQRNKKNLLYREKHPDTLTHPLDRKNLPAPQVQPILRTLCPWGPVPVCGVDLGVCGWAWGPGVWVSVRHGL